MSEGLRIGQFHHLKQSGTCPACGNALGMQDHREACESPHPVPPFEDILHALGLSSDKVRAIGQEILMRAEESGNRLHKQLK